MLFAILLVEGAVAASAVLALVPLADFLLDPGMANPNRITRTLTQFAGTLGLSPGFWLFGLLFVAFNLLKGLLDIATRFAILRIKYAIARDLVDKTLSNFFRARWEFFARADQGRLLNTFNKELTTVSDTLGALATQLAQLVQLAIYLAVPFWLNASMTLTAMALATVLGLPFLLLQRLSYRLGLRSTETANAMTGSLSEVLSAARLILGFARQNESKDRVLGDLDKHIHATVRSQSLMAAVALMFQPIGILSVVIAFGISLERGAPVAEMAALLWSLLRALPLMGGLLSSGVTIRGFLPSYEQLAALRNEAAQAEEISGSKEFSLLQSGLELRSVSFAYPGRADTLRKISLSIPKGKVTAIVGESGSGKSTITDLVLGLQSPAHGDVLIDGVPLPDWRQTTFREKVGYVPQEPFLFHTSIRNNLLWSAPHADENALWAACRLAHAEEFVRQMPEGLDTIVGDRGIRLSGGQRQRIALARALVRKPELLILDEATSSLDPESERLIQQSIDRVAGDTTILVVAHRLSTIAAADRIYVIHLGQVVEEGSFGELKAIADGYLGRMLASQESAGKQSMTQPAHPANADYVVAKNDG